MKNVSYLLGLLLSIFSCNTQAPIQFSEEALNDTFITQQGKSIAFKNILEVHKGKTIVIDIWASWCSDCIKGMPKIKALQKDYSDAIYVFLSLDKNQNAWKRGIKKYPIEGEHYFMPLGTKCAFADFVKINRIPRYMILNKQGNIELFKAVKANSDKLINALKNSIFALK